MARAVNSKVLRTVAAVLVVAAAGTSVWRLGSASAGPRPDPALEQRAEQIRSEIMDYAPPETNVPDTAPRPTTLQSQSTRRPQRVN